MTTNNNDAQKRKIIKKSFKKKISGKKFSMMYIV